MARRTLSISDVVTLDPAKTFEAAPDLLSATVRPTGLFSGVGRYADERLKGNLAVKLPGKAKRTPLAPLSASLTTTTTDGLDAAPPPAPPRERPPPRAVSSRRRSGVAFARAIGGARRRRSRTGGRRLRLAVATGLLVPLASAAGLTVGIAPAQARIPTVYYLDAPASGGLEFSMVGRVKPGAPRRLVASFATRRYTAYTTYRASAVARAAKKQVHARVPGFGRIAVRFHERRRRISVDELPGGCKLVLVDRFGTFRG